MIMEYSDKIIGHFKNPRNAGEIQDADGTGRAGDPSCGDYMKVWIKVSDDFHIEDIKFKCKGCPAAVALGSIMTEMAAGKHIDAAAEITDWHIEQEAGELPESKKHCSNIAAAALYSAIVDYVTR